MDKSKNKSKEVEIARVCKNCRNYHDKKCGVTGEYTARKKTCDNWEVK